MTRFSTLRLAGAFAMFVAAAMALPPAHAEAPAATERRLSLDDAIALALQNNTELAIAGYAPRRAAAEVEQQRGVFDPVLSVFAGIDRDRTPQGSLALGSFRHGVTAEASLSGRLSSGAGYSLGYGTTRLETDAQLAPSNPSSSGYVELQVRQPLLRGFGDDVNRAGITIARGNQGIADLRLRRQTEATIAATVDAYWRLVRAHRSLAVARTSLELAQRLVEQTQARVTAGDSPSIDLTQARASVAAREEAVILGEAEVGNANDALARLLVIDADQVFDTALLPIDGPDADRVPIEPTALLQDALQRRAEVAAARQAIRNAEVALAVARDRRRPDLSAVGSVGVGGLDPDWFSAHGELASDASDQYRWTAGLVLSVPLGNRSADGAHEQARLALDEARATSRSLELQITQEVRTAVRNLDASARRVEATRRAEELARAQLAAGEKRLGIGLSTAFEVLRLQADLAAAQHAEIAALVGYETSMVGVHLATGSLFGRHVRAPR